MINAIMDRLLMTEVETRDIPLNWDVFVRPGIPTVTSDLPPGTVPRSTGEGSIGIHEATSGKGKNYFQPEISINNSDIRLIEWVSKMLFDFRLYYAKENPSNRKIVYHALVIGIAPVCAVLSAVYPFLLLKKESRASVGIHW
jgi:hypothetical protein